MRAWLTFWTPLLNEFNRPPPAATVCRSLLSACATAGNRDLEPHVPALVNCIAAPGEVPAVIAKLSATTFVQVCGGRSVRTE